MEPLEAWGSFTQWLHAKPRPAPLSFGDLPTKWDWATRARLFDAFTEGAMSSEQQKISETVKNLVRIVHGEANKLLLASQLSQAPLLNAKDVISILAYLASDKGALTSILNTENEFDLSGVPTDKLKELQQLLKTARK